MEFMFGLIIVPSLMQAWLAREHLSSLLPGGVWPEGGVSQTFTVE